MLSFAFWTALKIRKLQEEASLDHQSHFVTWHIVWLSIAIDNALNTQKLVKDGLVNVLKLNSEWNMCYCTSFIMSKQQDNKTLSNVVSLTEGWTERTWKISGPSTCLEYLTDSSDRPSCSPPQVIMKWPVKWSRSSPRGLLKWSQSGS